MKHPQIPAQLGSEKVMFTAQAVMRPLLPPRSVSGGQVESLEFSPCWSGLGEGQVVSQGSHRHEATCTAVSVETVRGAGMLSPARQ